MSKRSKPTIALVYDWATTSYGGAEQVLGAIKTAFPKADFFTSMVSARAHWAKGWHPRTTFLQLVPLATTCKPCAAIFMPLAFESLDLERYDIIISVTSSYAKGVLTNPKQLHVCYAFTPPRFLYSHASQYQKIHPLLKLPIISLIYNFLAAYSRWWDRAAAFRPDIIIPLSALAQSRINHYYGITTQPPLYPPVQKPMSVGVSTQLRQVQPPSFYLLVSRLVKYKQTELAIEACKQLGKHLVIVGTGPEFQKLKLVAGNTSITRKPKESLTQFFERGKTKQASVYFALNCDSRELSELYQISTALLMPQVEDFGIAALEAASYGKPAIVSHQSGVAELLEEGKHAVYSMGESTQDLIAAINKLEKTKFSATVLKRKAEQYTDDIFIKKFRTLVLTLWKEHS